MWCGGIWLDLKIGLSDDSGLGQRAFCRWRFGKEHGGRLPEQHCDPIPVGERSEADVARRRGLG
jgi:hypothetical protein